MEHKGSLGRHTHPRCHIQLKSEILMGGRGSALARSPQPTLPSLSRSRGRVRLYSTVLKDRQLFSVWGNDVFRLGERRFPFGGTTFSVWGNDVQLSPCFRGLFWG